jgi:hypothetical protein
MGAILAALGSAVAALGSTYVVAMNTVDFPNKFPPPLNTIIFIFLIWLGWGAVFDLAGLLGLDLNLWGIILDGPTVAMVYVAAWAFRHFVGSL